MQDAYMVGLGVAAGSGNEELDYEFFDAIADNEDEANELMDRTNIKRFANQVKIKRG